MTVRAYRKAVPEDARACIDIRGRTRENAFSEEELRELGITSATWHDGIKDGSIPGYVCCIHDEMIGYCFGDRDTGEVVVLALLPEYEGEGIGKTLLHLVVQHFKARGHKKLFLGCSTDQSVRSYGFYRHLGWTSTGRFDAAGDEILELQAG